MTSGRIFDYNRVGVQFHSNVYSNLPDGEITWASDRQGGLSEDREAA
jgi:hypothetical protein